MKKQIVSVILAERVELDGILLDQVNTLIQVSDTSDCHKIRFERNTQYEYDAYDIIGERLETDAEARKRIDAKKKLREQKQKDKQTEIERLEKALAKLKAK